MVMNENYAQPGLVVGNEEGIIRGMYRVRGGEDKAAARKTKKPRVRLLGSGTSLRAVIPAADLLEADWRVSADVWGAARFPELRRAGLACDRHNLLHPDDEQQVPYVTRLLGQTEGPIVASTDYTKLFADQIRPFIPKGRSYRVLGTDGFGRSDFRYRLRRHFEVDRHFVVLAAVRELVEEGALPAGTVAAVIEKYGIDPDKVDPAHA